jgi:MFS family permease
LKIYLEGEKMESKEKSLHRNVILTGLTSFFTDVSTEMIYPLIQAFVSTILKTQAALIGPILGIIEGVAESTASILKLFSGYISDKIRKRKLLAIVGYAFSAFSKALFFIPHWVSILSGRILDRVGKGIRTSPRDALISESVPKELKGKAFGFQRGMDFAGAFLGTLISVLLVKYVFKDIDRYASPGAFFPVFAISIVPAFIAVIFLFFTTETQKSDSKPSFPTLNLKKYNSSLQLFFISQFIFTLGNSSNQFLFLRSTDIGYVVSDVIIMYLVFNLTTSITATYFGSLSDKIGRKKLLVAGYFLYGVVYLSFGFIPRAHKWLLWPVWILYGIYYAMTEGTEKAFISDLSPKDSVATALGFYQMIVGVTLLPASIIAGIMYSIYKPLPFIFGGLMAIVNCLIIMLGIRERKNQIS